MCRSLIYITWQNRIDNSPSCFNRYTFSRSVPARIHQICFTVMISHFPGQYCSIHHRMYCKKCFAKGRRKWRNRFRNTSFSPSQFRRIATNKMILSLPLIQNSHRRQHSVSICRQIYNFWSMPGTRRFYNIIDMINGITHPCILRNRSISKIYTSVLTYHNILQ